MMLREVVGRGLGLGREISTSEIGNESLFVGTQRILKGESFKGKGVTPLLANGLRRRLRRARQIKVHYALSFV